MIFPYLLKSEKANSPPKILSKPGPLANKKGNYEVNLCTSFCLFPLLLPKTSPRTSFHSKDPLSPPKDDIFSPDHSRKWQINWKSPLVKMCTHTHTYVREGRVRHRGRSPCRNTVHVSAVAVIPNSGDFFGGERGKTQTRLSAKAPFLLCLPRLGVQTPFPGWSWAEQWSRSHGKSRPR